MGHVNSCLLIVPAITYPPCILWKGLNQNSRQYPCDCTTQLTNISLSKLFYFKRPITYLQKTCLVSFRTCFYHSPIFDLPTLSFKFLLRRDPLIVKRDRSWTTSLGLYLNPVFIWLNLLPSNHQLTVTSYSWTTLLTFFHGQLNLLPDNF